MIYKIKFILGSAENQAPVVALVDWFMHLMSRVHFRKHSLYRCSSSSSAM